MKQLRIWPAEFVFVDDAGTTQVDVHLQARGREFHGVGRARRDSTATAGPATDEEVAAARALSDLSHQLLADAGRGDEG